jgi:hypothetical protein
VDALAAVTKPKEIKLPTTAQVIKAVTDAVKVIKLPAQPPKIFNPGSVKGCDGLLEDTSVKLCVLGDRKGSHSVVVYGDSHAHMWLPAFDAIGKHAHWKVVQLTKQACQVPDFPRWLGPQRRPYTECVAFRSFALASISKLHPDVVVLTSLWKGAKLVVNGRPTATGLDKAWATGLAKMIAKIKPMTGRVIVLGDMAYPKQAGDDCLPAHADDIRPCNTPRADAVFEAHNRMEQRVATQNGAQYVNTIPWFCTATVCPAVVAGLSTHADLWHAAPNYALWLSYALGTTTGLLSKS